MSAQDPKYYGKKLWSNETCKGDNLMELGDALKTTPVSSR